MILFTKVVKMSDMKCPICGGDMIAGGVCHYNQDCPIHDQNVPTEVLELLDRTRKALDIAINVLNRVKDVKYEEYIDEKLEQIESITKGLANIKI